VRIIEGPEVPEQTLRFFRLLQQGMFENAGMVMWYGQEKTEAEFLQAMVDEGRLIYEFEPLRTYGMY
jgi:hypothetical protein